MSAPVEPPVSNFTQVHWRKSLKQRWVATQAGCFGSKQTLSKIPASGGKECVTVSEDHATPPTKWIKHPRFMLKDKYRKERQTIIFPKIKVVSNPTIDLSIQHSPRTTSSFGTQDLALDETSNPSPSSTTTSDSTSMLDLLLPRSPPPLEIRRSKRIMMKKL